MMQLRKWILAAMTALALATPFAVAPSAQANPPANTMNRPRSYYLGVRADPDSPWTWYGPSTDYNLVRAWAIYLSDYGYQVVIR